MKFKSTLILLLSFGTTVLLLIFSADAANAARTALYTCAYSVIPVIFPLSVLALMIVSRLPNMGPSILSKIIGFAFDLSLPSFIAVIIGTLSGFPVGTKCAIELYNADIIKKEEAERVIALSSNAGAGFVIAVCGSTFFGSYTVGIYFYITEILASLLVAFFTSKHVIHESKKYKIKPNTAISLTDAITSSAMASVTIAGSIVFFSVTSSVITIILRKLYIPQLTINILKACIELSSGVRLLSVYGKLGICVSAAAISFSGICVISQLSSLAKAANLSIKKCIIYKSTEAVISFFCMLLLLKTNLIMYDQNVIASTLSCKTFIFYLPALFSFFYLIFLSGKNNE